MRVKVVFLLPGSGHRPVGGFKVAYEYANFLCSQGHQVEVHQVSRLDGLTQGVHLGVKFLKYVYGKMTHKYLPTSWFKLDGRVRVRWFFDFNPVALQDADAVVATAWQTAAFLKAHPELLARGAYLIQHQEFWSGSEEAVKSTWKLPLHKIVIARWLERALQAEGETSTYIPNGLDFGRFGLHQPIDARSPARIMMLYHDLDWKGSKDGIEALCLVKAQHPEVEVTLFGVPEKPELPEWIQYHQLPSQQVLLELYNQAAIFVAPSWAEGWPLPPAEAMMCGAALVATDIGGHQEYAFHEQTALLAEVKNPAALAREVIRLLDDPVLRQKIALQGHQFIQQFTWQRAGERMMKTLQQVAQQGKAPE